MARTTPAPRRLNIAMVSDYFYPKIGGVESHIYVLSQKLIERGHRVVVVTHHYGSRKGIRHLTNGLKVYHLPISTLPFSTSSATLPNLFTLLPLLRVILIREQIQVVHAHQALSSMGLESLLHSRSLLKSGGIKCIFTDHSLFGLGGGGWGEVTGNKMLKGVLSDVDGVICVSHTGKENTVLRAALNPDLVYVIPNAIDPTSFLPSPESADNEDGFLTIVCVSRLAYRKGITLLIEAIPIICASDPKVRFIIAGDGPERIPLEQMREKYQRLLNPPNERSRLILLGSIRFEQVRNVLIKGHVFLNTSLTEAFCISILEAACTGLFVVSTRVGGIPEVLPNGMIEFAEPEVNDLVEAVRRGLKHIRSGQHDPWQTHENVKTMYDWRDIAIRTEQVYYNALLMEDPPIAERLRRYYGCGLFFGKIMCIVIVVQYVLVAILDWWQPRDDIDIAPKFNYEAYREWVESRREEKLTKE